MKSYRATNWLNVWILNVTQHINSFRILKAYHTSRHWHPRATVMCECWAVNSADGSSVCASYVCLVRCDRVTVLMCSVVTFVSHSVAELHMKWECQWQSLYLSTLHVLEMFSRVHGEGISCSSWSPKKISPRYHLFRWKHLALLREGLKDWCFFCL